MASKPRCPTCNASTRTAYSRSGANLPFTPIPAAFECPRCHTVHQPRDLRELADWLADHGDLVPDNLSTNLPVFGGTEPEDTHSVWSWDETHLLVGDSFDDLKIELRE